MTHFHVSSGAASAAPWIIVLDAGDLAPGHAGHDFLTHLGRAQILIIQASIAVRPDPTGSHDSDATRSSGSRRRTVVGLGGGSINTPLSHHSFLTRRADSRIASGNHLIKRVIVRTVCVRRESDFSLRIDAFEYASCL